MCVLNLENIAVANREKGKKKTNYPDVSKWKNYKVRSTSSREKTDEINNVEDAFKDRWLLDLSSLNSLIISINVKELFAI